MFEMIDGMTEMTEAEAKEVVGGGLILDRCMWDAAKVQMQDFHFVM